MAESWVVFSGTRHCPVHGRSRWLLLIYQNAVSGDTGW